MEATETESKKLHRLLPIDANEKIIAIYKHHWFAYVSLWVLAITMSTIILGVTIFLAVLGNSDAGLAQFRAPILAGGIILAAIVLVSTLIPVWLKSQEMLVLTEEALSQLLRPTLFAAKTSQVNLEHINDVTVRRDFFGSMLGFGHITIETPGEQDDYEFLILPNPEATARQIISAHENYQAAVQSGRIPTTWGVAPVHNVQSTQPEIDPQQYQQFLQYQQMVTRQQQDSASAQQYTPVDSTGSASQPSDNSDPDPQN